MRIPPTGAKGLGEAKFLYLEELDLSDNPVTDEGVENLTQNEATNSPKLRTLLLRNTKLADDGLVRAVKAN